jgi:hypothetical protein
VKIEKCEPAPTIKNAPIHKWFVEIERDAGKSVDRNL